MYIGLQQIIKEKAIGDYVEVTLESTTERIGDDIAVAEGLGKTEKVVFNKGILELIKTEEEGDLTVLRDNRTKPVVGAILTTLLEYAVSPNDLEYIFQGVSSSLSRANDIKQRRVYGVHEDNQNVYEVKDELLG